MDKPFIDVLKQAEELLEAKKFKDIIEFLGEIDSPSISPEEKALYNLYFVEANLQLGNKNVKAELDYILDFYTPNGDGEKFAWAKHLHGWFLIATGDNFNAREPLLESYISYRRLNLQVKEARVLNRLGFLCFQLGDFDSAQHYLYQCLGIYGELKDEVRRLIIRFNLASLYIFRGDLARAIEDYSWIGSRIVAEWGSRNIGTMYIQASVPLALRGDYAQARKTLDKALTFIKDYAYERGSYFAFSGKLLYLENSFVEARKTQLEGIKLVRQIAPDTALMSQLKRQLAETLIELGEVDQAVAATNEAMSIATKLNEHYELAGCYRNLGQLEAHQGNSEKAREWFNKAIERYKKMTARYDLALTRYKAASSGIFQGGERQALLYLAREYFKSEKVTRYVDRINNQLNGVPVAPRLKPDRSQTRSLRIVTINGEMKRLVSMVEHVAPSDISVLLTGATGTGKDLFARYLHHVSGRSGSFVSINAAAIPDSMVESELFGHRRGSFTNADRDKAGLIEVAHNGTLYLNEIADASKELQAKLLDVLESRKVRRLGETKERQVGFRLIAATNHDLNSLVSEGRFRIDLYHRISEVPLSLPVLGDRPEDIRPLMVHFLSLAGVAVDDKNSDFQRLVKLLVKRDWPGNVRQLEAEAKRLTLLSGGDVSRMLQFISRYRPSERDQLLEILREAGWNRREAARKLGVSDTTIRRKIRKYNLYQD
jgi:transcriptional regulator with PAS, ATPase and Fis domain